MQENKILIVFYSRTGTTRRIALALAAALGCDVEEIIDHTPREGIRGYFRSGLDATLRRPAALGRLEKDPQDYDLVLVGTPVWNASPSAPVRTYLSRMRARIKNAAFFLTYGGQGSERVFRQMQGEALCRPVATLALRETEIRRGRDREKLGAFVAQLRVFTKRPSSTPLPMPQVAAPEHTVRSHA
ncbi:MAG TPA: flavodoxin [Polyangiales bacterium]